MSRGVQVRGALVCVAMCVLAVVVPFGVNAHAHNIGVGRFVGVELQLTPVAGHLGLVVGLHAGYQRRDLSTVGLRTYSVVNRPRLTEPKTRQNGDRPSRVRMQYMGIGASRRVRLESRRLLGDDPWVRLSAMVGVGRVGVYDKASDVFTRRSYHLVAQSSASRFVEAPLTRVDIGVGYRLLHRISSERVSERGLAALTSWLGSCPCLKTCSTTISGRLDHWDTVPASGSVGSSHVRPSASMSASISLTPSQNHQRSSGMSSKSSWSVVRK